MIEGKTKSGFKYKIDERILDDWRLIEAVGDAESNDSSRVVRGMTNLLEILLGDQADALKKHIADKNDGYIPKDIMLNTMIEIVKSSNELKNSRSSEG